MVVGGRPEAKGQSGKARHFWGKNACMRKATTGRKHNTRICKEGNNWKEEQHTHMGGRPNNSRVRVLVRYCNG
jgi:hypothetical protein